MLASELIQALTEAIAQHGNRPVRTYLAAVGQAPVPQCGCEPMEYGNGPDNTNCLVHGQVPGNE